MPINVVAVGGLFGSSTSLGLKTTQMLLRPEQEKGHVDFMPFYDFKAWKAIADDMVGWKDDTFFLVHSYGVAAVMGIVRRLRGRGPRIPLIISWDPSQHAWMSMALWGTGGNAVPNSGVETVHNFWQQGWPIGYQRLVREDGSLRGIENEEIDSSHAGAEDVRATQEKAVRLIKLKAGLT